MAFAVRRKHAPVNLVQIDGLVVLKIIKHSQEEGSTVNESVQGVLLGLVENGRVEVTNCFPFPNHSEPIDDKEKETIEVQYQLDMMKNLRHVNVDHLHVGWYQSTYMGTFFNKALVESQFNYQHSIDESVVLVYDPLMTAKGKLSLKALRLTPSMMQMYKETDFTPEALKASGISFESMFEEVPIVITNSHLVNYLFCEIEEVLPPVKDSFLDLSSGVLIEKNLRLLVDYVDELTQDNNKYFAYQRQVAKQNQNKQSSLGKRQQENKLRHERGEAPIPDDDIHKSYKALPVPSRLESLLLSSQIASYCDQLVDVTNQNLGKLFVVDSINSSFN